MAKYVGAQPRVSGNRIDGGTITTFKSTGIDDNATATKITVVDASTTFAGNILPDTDSSKSLGATGTRFLNLFVDDVTATTSISVPTINVGTALLPDANDDADIGSTTKGFNDLFLADNGVIKFGNDQDVTLTHNPDVGLTLNTKLVVSGDFEANAGSQTQNITVTGGTPVVTIKDNNTATTAADAEIAFVDSANTTQAQVGIENNKLMLITEDDDAGASGITLGLGTRTTHLPFQQMDESGSIAVRVNGQTNIAFNNSGTITGGGSSFGAVNANDIITVTGAGQVANNKEFRVTAKAGDVLTVIGDDGALPATESAGATVTVTQNRVRNLKIANTVNATSYTAPQTDNTDRISTTKYVRNAIAGLIDSSPGALDTLNELAAAIGDDANFGATTTAAIANRIDLDLSNLSATGIEALNDRIGAFGGGTMTFPGTGNSIALTHDDSNNHFDLAVALNDPVITVATTGAVTGTANATMTDLQNVSISIGTTLASGAVTAAGLDQTGSGNIVKGLPVASSIQNADLFLIADASDSFALKSVVRSVAIPPGLAEDLGFFAIAMS
jgi:hypothetical protein|tara:strand:+ start:36957 stop:38636 length:1680 start_codon:yes stop_codon:yes gene_type:complete